MNSECRIPEDIFEELNDELQTILMEEELNDELLSYAYENSYMNQK